MPALSDSASTAAMPLTPAAETMGHILDLPARLDKRQEDQQTHWQQEEQANPFAGIRGMAAQATGMRYVDGEWCLPTNWPVRMIQEGY